MVEWLLLELPKAYGSADWAELSGLIVAGCLCFRNAAVSFLFYDYGIGLVSLRVVALLSKKKGDTPFNRNVIHSAAINPLSSAQSALPIRFWQFIHKPLQSR